MSNLKLINSGAGSLADLARMGGDVAGNMTDDALKNYGAGFWPDMARLGGAVLGPTIDGTPVLTGQSGVAYAGFTVTASGGTEPYTYSSVGTWPTGISVNVSTGEVSGTPTQDGTFPDLSVKVADDNDHEAQLPTFTLVIDPA